MKDLFIAICDRLESTVSELKWVDLDKGQVDQYDQRPAVQFPCALVGLQITRTLDISAKRQECQALVTVRLAMDFTGNTSTITPAAAREQSLKYFDIADSIFDSLHGYGIQGSFNYLKRQSLREERRPDHYKVVSIPFTTSFIQQKSDNP